MPFYSDSAFSSRLLATLSSKPPEAEGVSALEVARSEEIAVLLAKELLEGVELGEEGKVARDDGGGEGTRWYENEILNFVWDDPNGAR